MCTIYNGIWTNNKNTLVTYSDIQISFVEMSIQDFAFLYAVLLIDTNSKQMNTLLLVDNMM